MKDDQQIVEIMIQIAVISCWLRDHPHADREARHDKIQELAALNEQLDNLEKD